MIPVMDFRHPINIIEWYGVARPLEEDLMGLSAQLGQGGMQCILFYPELAGPSSWLVTKAMC